MSLQYPSSPVYQTSAERKRNAKIAARKYRYGTPKLRDILREKCRLRIQEARQACFAEKRGLTAQFQFDIEKILRSELSELEQNIKLQDQIYNELYDEFNEWCSAELENEEAYLINMESQYTQPQELLCPVCMKHPLTLDQADIKYFKCACAINFYFNGSVQQLRQTLQLKINEHEEKCVQPLRFFVEPHVNGQHALIGFCDNCEYFISL